MELRVLNYFLTVARTGSITAAATQLHVGQPTLSRQLKELEEELGQKLFERRPHGVSLTKEGELLRTYAMQMTSIARKIEEDFSVMRTNPMGDLHCGGIETARFHKFAPLIKYIHVTQPGITFHYHTGSYLETATMLDRGLLDFGLVYAPDSYEKYHAIELHDEERWVAYLRADHPLAHKAALTADDLADEPLLMYDQIMHMPYNVNDLARWFGERFSDLRVMGTSNLTYINNIMAQEGIGILITWESLAETEVNCNMVAIPLDPPAHARVALIWSKGRPLSPTAEYFLEVVREYLAARAR